MTLDDVLQDLIRHLETGNKINIGWEQVRNWPEEAVAVFEEAGWIQPAEPAQSVVCPGCEEACFMPVHTRKAPKGQARSFVACDRRDDMGRIPIPSEYLNQWQITPYRVARWIHKALGMKDQPKWKDKNTSLLIGTFHGRKKSGELVLELNPPITLHAGDNPIPLGEVVYIYGAQLTIDKSSLKKLVDRPPPNAKIEKPVSVKREAGKQETQKIHKSWQKLYRLKKSKNPDLTDEAIAIEISENEIGKGRKPETIRRRMKG